MVLRTEFLRSVKKGQVPVYSLPQGMNRFTASLNRGADILVRVTGMLLLAGLLLYCDWITAADGWYDDLHCPANCGFGMSRGGSQLSAMIADYVLVIWSYSESCLMLWPLAGRWLIDSLRHKILDDKGLQTIPDVNTTSHKQGEHVGKKKLPLWRRVFIIVLYFVSSEIINLLLNGFIWFTVDLRATFDDRSQMHDSWGPTESQKENSFEGFGQLLPLLLLGLPFLQVLETYSGEYIPFDTTWETPSIALPYVVDTNTAIMRKATPLDTSTGAVSST
jgi:hypothetical protein